MKKVGLSSTIIQISSFLFLWSYLSGLPFLSKLFTLDSFYGAIDVLSPHFPPVFRWLTFGRIESSLYWRDSSFIDRYLYYFFLMGVSLILNLLMNGQFIRQTEIILGFTCLPIFLLGIIEIEMFARLSGHVWSFIRKMARKTMCVTFAALVNKICQMTLDLHPNISRKEISVAIKETSFRDIYLFIRIVVVTQIIKTIEKKLSISAPFLRVMYNRGSFVEVDPSRKYEDPFADITNPKDKLRTIIMKRRFEQFCNPHILRLMEELYLSSNDDSLWKEGIRKLQYYSLLTSKFSAVYVLTYLFKTPLSMSIFSLLLLDKRKLHRIFIDMIHQGRKIYYSWSLSRSLQYRRHSTINSFSQLKSTKNTSKSSDNTSKSSENTSKSSDNTSKSSENSMKSSDNSMKSSDNSMKSSENAGKSCRHTMNSSENTMKSYINTGKSWGNPMVSGGNTGNSTGNTGKTGNMKMVKSGKRTFGMVSSRDFWSQVYEHMTEKNLYIRHFDLIFVIGCKLAGTLICFLMYGTDKSYVIGAMICEYGELLDNPAFWWLCRQMKKKWDKYRRVLIPLLDPTSKLIISDNNWPSNWSLLSHGLYVMISYRVMCNLIKDLGQHQNILVGVLICGLVLISRYPLLLGYFLFFGLFSMYQIGHFLTIFIIGYLIINLMKYPRIPENVLTINQPLDKSYYPRHHLSSEKSNQRSQHSYENVINKSRHLHNSDNIVLDNRNYSRCSPDDSLILTDITKNIIHEEYQG
jgi:hypothetical protein